MQKVKWILLLAVICIFAMSLPSMAQLASGNWPRPGRDYYNSGKSPATVIAKPVLKWTAATPARDFTFDGIQIDSQGNIYTGNDYEFYVRKYNSSGTQLWQTSVASHNNFYMYYGLAMFDDGTNQYVIGGPQQAGWADEPSLYAINPSSGAKSWQTTVFDIWHVTGIPAPTGKIGSTSNVSPAIGPDGTIYTGNLRDGYYDPAGALYAFNKDGSRKWVYNEYGQGDSYGSAAIKQVNGKNIIYTASGIYNASATGAYAGYAAAPNILAIQDDVTSASTLWTANIGFVTSQPVLSADGNTVYVAGRESRPSATTATFVNTNVGLPNFIALDATSGAVKWSLVTGSRAAYSPTLGPDGTIYVCGGFFRTGNQSSGTPDVEPTANPGKLIAIKDNGATGEIKWTLPLPDDEVSDTTRVATISTSPTTMYVATGNGRVYCVQDMGDQPKILWTWQAFSTRYCGVMQHGFTPSNIAIADDGTVYTGWGQTLYAFDTGFDPSNPIGITGTVKDADGNPIAGAWVAASTSARPLADNAKRLWTKTNSDGTYQISPKDAGTYYVAAAADGYTGSEDQTAAFTTVSTAVSGVDFTLSPAKYNWAIGAVASSESVNGNCLAGYAVDGDRTTRYASTAASTSLVVDLGVTKTIDEAVIYWWFNYGKAYTLDWSTDGITWTTTEGVAGNAYTTTTGNGGFPLEFYPCDPTVAKGVGGTTNYSGGPKISADVIKFSPVTARYWRVNFTSVKNFYGDSLFKTGPSVFGSAATYASIWDIELRDSTRAGVPAPNTISAAKSAQDGDGVAIATAVITAVPGAGLPANNICIESADRTSGIRVDTSAVTGLDFSTIGFGDKVTVAGRMQTADGVKYIAATSVARLSSGIPVDALGINNRDATSTKGLGLFVKTWGNVTTSDATSFTITDGSSSPIKVLCGSIAKPSNGATVKVRGVAGKDSSGPVLYMRNEPVDWIAGDAEYQPLPLPGPYKYPREYAVCGPFSDANSTVDVNGDGGRGYRLDHDFILDATGTSEDQLRPNLGDACGDKTWIRAEASNDTLDFTKIFPENNANSTIYAHLWIYTPTAQYPGFRAGSDDGIRVWLNGSVIDNVPGSRGVVIGQDYVQFLTLNAGFNSVMFKVENGEGGFGLISQFIDESVTASGSGYGAAVPYLGLGYALSKPAGF